MIYAVLWLVTIALRQAYGTLGRRDVNGIQEDDEVSSSTGTQD